MLVKVQMPLLKFGKHAKAENRKLAQTVSHYLTPASIASSIVALWCLATDLKFTGRFGLPAGILSRWQVWMGMAIVFQVLASRLNRRYGRDDGAAMP